jgi:hypothetical protein
VQEYLEAVDRLRGPFRPQVSSKEDRDSCNTTTEPRARPARSTAPFTGWPLGGQAIKGAYSVHLDGDTAGREAAPKCVTQHGGSLDETACQLLSCTTRRSSLCG